MTIISSVGTAQTPEVLARRRGTGRILPVRVAPDCVGAQMMMRTPSRPACYDEPPTAGTDPSSSACQTSYKAGRLGESDTRLQPLYDLDARNEK